MDLKAMWHLVRCMLPGFTDHALDLLVKARELAEARNHRKVTPEHLLLVLVNSKRGVGRAVLEQLGIDFEEEQASIASLVSADMPPERNPPQSFSGEMERIIAQAKAEAKELGHAYVAQSIWCWGSCIPRRARQATICGDVGRQWTGFAKRR